MARRSEWTSWLRRARPSAGVTARSRFLLKLRVICEKRWSVARGAQAESEWNVRFTAYEAAYPEDAEALKCDLAGELPSDWDAGLDELLGAFEEPIASRAVSGQALAALTNRVDSLTGGSADLAPSNNTRVQGRGSFQAETYPGRNMHFGVREHSMGAIANGMAAHGGLIPYTGTFLIFSDYMRPAPAVGCDEWAAFDIHLYARLDWTRRGRPDASTDLPTDEPAVDPRPHGRTASRRARDA